MPMGWAVAFSFQDLPPILLMGEGAVVFSVQDGNYLPSILLMGVNGRLLSSEWELPATDSANRWGGGGGEDRFIHI